jgi:uncharacterized membrane protein YcaP (DUF421 family)
MRSLIQLHLQNCLGIGVDPKEFTLPQLLLRSLIVFTTMYLMIRIAGRRFMAQKNACDVVLAFLVASMLARAINGSAAFWANIALGFIIAAVYRLVAWAACEYPCLGRLLKGHAIEVVVDGKVRADALRRHHISLHDLEEDMRLTGNVGDPSDVKLARLERSGDISTERKSKIINITIEDGVKRVELHIH